MNKNSYEAYILTGEFKNKHYEKIYSAIKIKGIATRYCISETITLTPEQVGRRLSEMQRLGLIKFDSDKEINGRMCSAYRIRKATEFPDVVKKNPTKAELECVRLYEWVEKLQKENQELRNKINTMVSEKNQLKLF